MNLILLGILVILNIINTISNFLNMIHNRKREKILDEAMKKKRGA